MVHVSEAASLALHSMLLLVEAKSEPRSAAQLAQTTGASQAHLAKVLQRLAKAGLVRATRGPGGGYVLAPSGSDITLLQVYEAIEGPLCTTNCMLKQAPCPFQRCLFGGVLGKLTQDFRQYLASNTLGDVVAPCI